MGSDAETKVFAMVVFMLAAIAGGIVGWAFGHDCGMTHGTAIGNRDGFHSGVLAHAEGRYVVVELPDGSKVVCENKKETKP